MKALLMTFNSKCQFKIFRLFLFESSPVSYFEESNVNEGLVLRGEALRSSASYNNPCSVNALTTFSHWSCHQYNYVEDQ